jgi:sugar lactone lactonase YvrE
LAAALPIQATAGALSADRLEAYYPEGPILAGERILFAEMHQDRIIAWGEDRAEVLYERAGCGPSAIAPYDGGYAVLCHLANEVQLISKKGKAGQRLQEDLNGQIFLRPNDASADKDGGVYFSAAGIFNREAPAQGAILYLDRNGAVHRLAQGLHYANGVHFDARQKLLFVSEHLGRRILSYPVIAPGCLGRPAIFADFEALHIFDDTNWPLSGPDGMETDENGNLYSAYYGAGALLIFSPDGDILRRLEAPAPLITNVALDRNGRAMVITASHRRDERPYPGAVVKLANPLFAED